MTPDPVIQSAPQAKALTSSSRMKPFIYVGFLICMALIWAVIWLSIAPHVQSQETCYATVHIARKTPSILLDSREQTQETDNDFERFKLTQVRLIKTRFVLNAALKNPEIAQLTLVKEQIDPVAWLEKNLKAGFIDNTDTLRIGLRGSPSKERAQLINAVVKAYLNEIIFKEKNQCEERYEKLKKVYARFEEMRQARKQALEDFFKTTGMGPALNFDLKQQIELAQVTAFTGELSRLRLNKILVLAQINVKKNGNKGEKENQAAIGKLEEEAATISEQEKLIIQAITDLEKTKNSKLDLASLENDLRNVEGACKKIAQEIMYFKVETFTPPRIQLLEEAS